MANGVTPYWPVPAPAVTPTRYGLFAAFTPIEEPHGEWEYGTVWDDSNVCTHGGLWQPCCSPFAGQPSAACRPVAVQVQITAQPAAGGGADILAEVADDWTGPPVTVDVTVGGLGPTPVASGSVVNLGNLPCGATYGAVVQAPATPFDPAPTPDTGELVVTADTPPGPDACTATLLLTVRTCVAEPDQKSYSTTTLVYGDPFVAYDGRTCPTLNEAQLRASATERLALSEQRQIEQQFWRGPTYPHLADPATVVLGGGNAQSPAMGVALLEGFLADNYLGVGYLHAPRYTAGLLHREQQVAYELGTGPTLQTSIGTRWVFGSGYPTVGPDGTLPPAGHAWLYVTGALAIRVSPVVVNTTRDTKTGCVTALAERTVVIGRQCDFTAAVLVDFARCDCCEPAQPA